MARSINSGAREWDAETYDAVSDPQFEWGAEVVERLELRGDETALDAGCGSGRVTELLLERLPRGRVLAVDGSAAMIEKARERLGDRADYLHADPRPSRPKIACARLASIGCAAGWSPSR